MLEDHCDSDLVRPRPYARNDASCMASISESSLSRNMWRLGRRAKKETLMTGPSPAAGPRVWEIEKLGRCGGVGDSKEPRVQYL